MEPGIWEIRTDLENRIARVFVTKSPDMLVILHGFIKKTQKTPLAELEIARKRLRTIKKGT